MKHAYIYLISLFGLAAPAVAQEPTIIQLDSQSIQQIKGDSGRAAPFFINAKFRDKQVHSNLLHVPEFDTRLNGRLIQTQALSKSKLEALNLEGGGDREQGLSVLQSIYNQTGIMLKHVRSASLGTDKFIVISDYNNEVTIENLKATGYFEFVAQEQKITPNTHISKPASLPARNDVGTNALERNAFNDSFYLNESYLDEQDPNAMGAHSLLKASLYASENNNLGRKVRVAVIDTGSYPNEDIVWEDEGADFISGSTSSTYFDCAVVDETNSGVDAVCAVEDFRQKQRDTDPTDKSWEFSLDSNGNPTEDGNIYIDGHGLSVGSLIAAKRNNNVGIVSALDAEDVALINVRALFPDGGTDSDVSDAIVWASGGEVPGMPNISQKVDVINLSLGGFGLDDCENVGLYRQAIAFARSQNVVVIGAAGNDGRDVDGYAPGECAGVLTVGANNLQGEITNFSNFGDEVEVTFEGAKVYSATINTDVYIDPANSQFCGIDGTPKTTENCYATGSGTSFAAPFASATAAMVRMVQSSLDESQIRALIAKTAPLYEQDSLGQQTQRAALVPNAGLGNAYLAVTTTFDSVSLDNLEAAHRYANFNSGVEQNYMNALIANSNKESICSLYEFAWSSYREEINGVNYVLYGSNSADSELTEENATPLNTEGTSQTSGLFNIGDFNRVAIQAVVDNAPSQLHEFDLTQASRPVSCL